jgi:hypothetical protein
MPLHMAEATTRLTLVAGFKCHDTIIIGDWNQGHACLTAEMSTVGTEMTKRN